MNYRPISNLQVLAKLLERIVAKQINMHGLMSRTITWLQSTETALMKVTGYILCILDV